MAFQWDPVSLQACIANPNAMLAAFRHANRDGSGAVSGGDAVAFFSGSGLSTEKLSEIWRAATNGEPSMQPMAFKTAMELIAGAVDVGTPAPAPAAEPGLYAPSMPAAPSMPGGTMAILGASKFLSASKLPTSVPEGSDMTPVEYKKYKAHYGKLPGGKQGWVGFEDAVRFLSKAKLDPEDIETTLRRITGGGAGLVSCEHFAVAMHETYKAIKQKGGKTPAPGLMMVTPAPGLSVANVDALSAPPAPDFGGGRALDSPAVAAAASNDFGGFGAFGGAGAATSTPAPVPTNDSGFGAFGAFDAPPRPTLPVPVPVTSTNTNAETGTVTASVSTGLAGGDFDFGGGGVNDAEPSNESFGGFNDFGGPAASAPAPSVATVASTPDDGFGGFGGDFSASASAPTSSVAASPAPPNAFGAEQFGGSANSTFGASLSDTSFGVSGGAGFGGDSFGLETDSFGMETNAGRLNAAPKPSTDFSAGTRDDRAATRAVLEEASSKERAAGEAAVRADGAQKAALEMSVSLADAKVRAERAETEASAAAQKASEAEASVALAERERDQAAQTHAEANRRKADALARAERASVAASEIRHMTSTRERESQDVTAQLEQDAEAAEHALEKVKAHAVSIGENVAKASASARARVAAARGRADDIRDSANRDASAAKATAEAEAKAVREETIVAHGEVERLKLQREREATEHEKKIKALRLELEEAERELENARDVAHADAAVGSEPLRAMRSQIEVVRSELRRLRDESAVESTRATAALVAASVELAEAEEEICEAKLARQISEDEERAAMHTTEASLAVAMEELETLMQQAEDTAEAGRVRIEHLNEQIAAAKGAAEESLVEAVNDAKKRAAQISSDEKELADAVEETERVLAENESRTQTHWVELQVAHERVVAAQRELAETTFNFETEAEARAGELSVARHAAAEAEQALEKQRAELTEISQKEIDELNALSTETNQLKEITANERETHDAECEGRRVATENARQELELARDNLEIEKLERAKNSEKMDLAERNARAALELDRKKFGEQLSVAQDSAACARLAAVAKTAILEAIEAEAVTLRATVQNEQHRVDSERAALEHDLCQREQLLATEQLKLASTLERLRYQRPREGASARQVVALEQARLKAEEERVDAEKREQEARAHVEENLAQLRSLAVAVAKATGAAAHARAGAAAAEQLAATNVAAAARSRAAVAGTSARQKAEAKAAERIAAAKAEAQRIIKARNTPRRGSVAGTPITGGTPAVGVFGTSTVVSRAQPREFSVSVVSTPVTPAFASAELFGATPPGTKTFSESFLAQATPPVAATPAAFSFASDFGNDEFAFAGDTTSVAPVVTNDAFAPAATTTDVFAGFAAFDHPTSTGTAVPNTEPPASAFRTSFATSFDPAFSPPSDFSEPKSDEKSPGTFAETNASPHESVKRGMSLTNEDFAAFEVELEDGEFDVGTFGDDTNRNELFESGNENEWNKTDAVPARKPDRPVVPPLNLQGISSLQNKTQVVEKGVDNANDEFADFSDDDEYSEIEPAPPASSKLAALLKKGVTIAAPTSTPVGSNAFADFSSGTVDFDKETTFEESSSKALSTTFANGGDAPGTENVGAAVPTGIEPALELPEVAPTDTAGQPTVVTTNTAPNDTFDEDGFADFESEDETVLEPESTGEGVDVVPETSAPASPQTASASSVGNEPSEIASPISPDDRAQFDAVFDAYTSDNPPGVSGLTGAQLVQITASTGLAQADLSKMWQLVSAPGHETLRRDDFVLFCSLLKKRVAGGGLPGAVDADTRAFFFSETGGETCSAETGRELRTTGNSERRGTAPTETGEETAPLETREQAPTQAPQASQSSSCVVVVVESFRGVKDCATLKNVCVSVTLLDRNGTVMEPARTTPMGAATVKPGGVVVFETPVRFSSVRYDSIQNGSALLLELKHFKEGQKKMSVKCWAVFENENGEGGFQFAAGVTLKTAKLAKPVKSDPKGRRKAKPFAKSGGEDVVVRFQ